MTDTAKPPEIPAVRRRVMSDPTGLKKPAEPAAKPPTFNAFCNETSLAGFKYLVGHNSTIRKILWLVLLIVASIVMCYQCWVMLCEYRDNPIVTNIDVVYPDRQDDGPFLHYPAVTICNNNQFRISKAKDHNLYGVLNSVFGGRTVNENADLTQAKNSDFADSRKLYLGLGTTIQDFLIDCYLPSGERCTADDFTTTLTDFGVCYTINSDIQQPIPVSEAGSHKSLHLLLNAEAYEFMAGESSAIGVKVILTNQTDIPITSRSIEVPPGYLTQIGVDYVERERVPIRKGGHCVTSTDGITYFDVGTSDLYCAYSAEKCHLDRVFKNIRSSCGCEAYNSPKAEDGPVCSPEQHFGCVLQTRDTVATDTTKCPSNCTTIEMPKWRFQQVNCVDKVMIIGALEEAISQRQFTTIPNLSMARMPLSVIEQSLTEASYNQINQAYRRSLEARYRLDANSKAGIDLLINSMLQARETLRSLQLEPVICDGIPAEDCHFKNSFVRLNESAAYHTLTTEAESNNPLLTYDWYIDSADKMYIFSLRILHEFAAGQAVEYEDSYHYNNRAFNSSYLLENYETIKYDRIAEVFNLTNHYQLVGRLLREIIPLFIKAKHHGDLTTSFAEYKELMQKIDAYRSGAIWLQTLAEYVNSIQPTFIADWTAVLAGYGRMDSVDGTPWYTLVQRLVNQDDGVETLMAGVQDPSVVAMLAASATQIGRENFWAGLGETNQYAFDGFCLGATEVNCMEIYRNDYPEYDYPEVDFNTIAEFCAAHYNIDLATLRQLICPLQFDFDIRDFVTKSADALTELYPLAAAYDEAKRTAHTSLTTPFSNMAAYSGVFLLKLEIDDDFYLRNILGINVYFQQMSKQIYVQSPRYNIWSFLCDIGGAIGLFLGASIMSAVELIDFFCVRPTLYLSNRNRNRPVTAMPPATAYNVPPPVYG